MTTNSPVLSSIDMDVALTSTDVTVYFARDGQRHDFFTSEGKWTNYARAQAMAALDSYAAVSNLTFTVVNDPAQATFRLTKTGAPPGASLGFMKPPDPNLGDAQGLVWFNSDPYWSGPKGGMLDPGSYMFSIFLHEFGHGLALAHPFDTGGGSTVIPAVGPGLGLDQGVFTVMTYNDGWPEAPAGAPDSRSWGWNLTLSPIDIAVIQSKYGGNTETGAGPTEYRLPATNGPGTGYAAIWDTGGRDRIIHEGATTAVIDLRAATLQPEIGGGGFVSYVTGIHGGVTIAHGAVIEDAQGGSAADVLHGNSDRNTLDGGAGHDTLRGEAGSDTLLGSAGRDQLFGGRGRDIVEGGPGRDVLTGGNGRDTLIGGPGRDTLSGGNGPDRFVFAPGDKDDRVLDFTSMDRLDVTAFGFTSFDQIEARMSNDGDKTEFNLEGVKLRVFGDDVSQAQILWEVTG